MNQKRRVSAVLLLRCQHDPQSFLHFLRMPDIVLIREQDVVGVSSEGMENAHEMACRASGRFRPLHELHPVRIQFLIIAGDAGSAVRRHVIRNKQTDAGFRLLQDGQDLCMEILLAVPAA